MSVLLPDGRKDKETRVTPEEFLLEHSKTTAKTETATTVSDPRTRRVRSGSDRDRSTCVVDEYGYAQYMVMTEDGRWVPAEDY